MPIPANCPACGHRFAAPDGPAGSWTACPKCNTYLVVPTGIDVEVIDAPPVAGRPAIDVEVIDDVVVAKRVPKANEPQKARLVPTAAPIKTATPVEPARPRRRFTDDGPKPKRRHPTNRAVVVTGVIAGLAAFGWLASVFGMTGWLTAALPAALLTALFAGSFFGGMCASTLTGVARFRHCILAGLWAFAALLLAAIPFVALLLWMSTRLDQATTPPGGEAAESPNALQISLPVFILLVAVTPFLMMAGFLLGGAFDVLLTAAGRGMGTRDRWTYHTQSGQSFPVFGPWRNPFLRFIWSGIGWAMLFTCWVPLLGQDITGCLSAFALGHTCRRLARKHGAVSVRDALEKDRRPPIVYLRSFQDDGLFQPGTFYLANDWLRTLSESTAEDTLATSLAPYGPVVAIGRPEEEMPEVGSARIYVGDDHWQALILDLITERGALAVFQAGGTKGLQWEMETVAVKLHPEQVLLFLPFGLHRSRKKRDAGYAAFRGWANDSAPAELPTRIGDGVYFLYFAARPEVETYPLERDGPVLKAHPLRDILRDLRTSRKLHPWGLVNWRRFFRTLLLAAVLGVVLGVSNWVWRSVVGGATPPATPTTNRGR